MTRDEWLKLAQQRAELAISDIKSLLTGNYGPHVSVELLAEAKDLLLIASRNCEEAALIRIDDSAQ